MSKASLNKAFLLVVLVLAGWLQASLQPGSSTEICNNGVDDDGNGLIDCFDPVCSCIEPCFTEHYFYPCEDDCEIRPDCDNFSAFEKWESNVNVGSYPVLVAGDIDNDGVAEVVTYELETDRIIIMNGTNGIAERFITAPGILKGGMAPAIADLDNDGFAEIIVVTEDRDLVAYHHDGYTYFHEPGVVGYDDGYAYAVIGVADFDQDGTPEIYIGNQIFSNTGQLVAEGGANNSQGVHPERAGDFSFNATVAIDALSESTCAECAGLELVAGNQIYVVDLANGTMDVYSELQGFSDGYTSVADINMDGNLDAVVQGMRGSGKSVYAWDLVTGNLLGNFDYTAGLQNGASRINIGDLDADGNLEMCFSAHPDFYAIDHNFNLLWTLPIYDLSSVTASTIFDFCGDGKAKILYRDEVELKVIDGSTGTVIWTYSCASSTHIENPLVLDVDGDNQTDICVVCGNSFSRGRVYALSPSSGNWAKSRPVWNQHGYLNVNINDDLSVPQIQQNHHIVDDTLVLNGFMNQYASFDFRAADLEIIPGEISCDQDTLSIAFEVCNRGSLTTSRSYNTWIISKRPDAAAAADLLRTRTLNTPLAPDDCIQLKWKLASAIAPDSIFLVANANQNRLGQSNTEIFPFSSQAECDYSNNLRRVDLGHWIRADFVQERIIDVCENDTLRIRAQAGGMYNWEFAGQMICQQCPSVYFKPEDSGWLYLSKDGVCGRDSVEITVSPMLSRRLDVTICEGDAYRFGPDMLQIPGTYQRTARSQSGCDTSITLVLKVDSSIVMARTELVCEGEAFEFRGQSYTPGTHEIRLSKTVGCDTLLTLDVAEHNTPQIEWTADRSCDDRTNVRLHLTRIDEITAVEVGSYFYLAEDEIYADTGYQNLRVIFKNGCEVEYELYTPGIPEVVTTAYPETCEGSADGAIRATPSSVVSHIQWQGTVYNGSAISEVPAGRYDVIVTDTLGCQYPVELVVRKGAKPSGSIDEEYIVPFGQSRTLRLAASGNGPLDIRWYPDEYLSCSNCMEPVFSGKEDMDYSIMIMDRSGCMTELRTRVKIDYQKKVFIPNAFTPNGDGLNDEFYPEMAPGVRSLATFHIYSRWGDLIYQMSPSGTGWDGNSGGKACNPGVYVYRCVVLFEDGTTGVFTGDVTLIR